MTFASKAGRSQHGCGKVTPERVEAPRTSARNRMRLGLFDQVLSSASNMLVVFAVAITSSVDDFGALMLILATLSTVIATGRGLLGTPISLLSAEPDRLRREARHALGAATWSGLAAGAIIAVLAVLTHSPPAAYFISLATPFVLIQDTGRYYCISAGRPRRAVLSDGMWAAGSGALLLVTWAAPGAIGSATLVGVWASLTLLAMLVILVPLRLVPILTGLVTWWHATLHDRLRFGAEAVIGATASLLLVGITTAIIGMTATAALRGAGSVLGPLNILLSAIPLVAVAELRRHGTVNGAEMWRSLRKIALPMSALAVGIGMSASMVPTNWGELILGDSWTVVRPLLPITAIEYAALAWLSAAGGGLRAQGRSSALLKLRVVFAGSSIVLGSLAAIVTGSVRMVAVALAVAAVMSAVLARHMLLRDPHSVRHSGHGAESVAR